MDAILEFNVSNQIITRIDEFKTVSDSVNYLYAHFNFLTDDWSNAGTPTAIFTNDETSYEVVLDTNNTCLVPHEVLATDDRYIFVSVFAGDRITANTAKVFVIESGWSDDLESSTPPTPSVYDQIIDRMDDVEDAVLEATQRTETAADKAELAVEHYPQIVDGYWVVWDAENEEFVNTDIKAEAHDGTSATVTVDTITGGHRVIITDVSGEHIFDVPDGRGIVNVEKIGTSGDVDTYRMTFTYGEPLIYYVTNGVSSTISTQDIYNGHRLTITDKNGTKTVDVMDGAAGGTGNGVYSITKTAEYQNVDYYTITYTNGTKTTFPVTNGYSPTVTVATITGGHRITITDANGDHSFDVMDGSATGGASMHICSSSEYDATTGVPTIQNPDTNTFYLVPAEDGVSHNMFVEWVYANNAWEIFGSVDVDLSDYATKAEVDGKVDKITGKGLSTNDYTTDEKTKLSGIATGAEVNVQSNWNQADTSADDYIKNKPSIPVGSSTTPSMDGTASTGSSTTWARADHVHPSDTSKVDKVNGKGLSTNDYTTTEKTKLSGIAEGAEVNVQSDWNETTTTSDAYIKNKPSIPSASSTTPSMDGTAAVGVSTTWARADHVHPSDTSKVDKETGKGLSTNDFTNAEKDKLAFIETGAEKNRTYTAKYTEGHT